MVDDPSSQKQQPQRLKAPQEPPFPLAPSLLGIHKDDFEIVVARYDEDISWLMNYKHLATVYNKGSPESIPSPAGNWVTHPLPNRGHLADTILHHILAHYDDSLATTTFFCHGSINYRPDQLIRPRGTGPAMRAWEDFCVVDPMSLIYIPRRDHFGAKEGIYKVTDAVGDVYTYLFEGEPYNPPFDWGCGKWVAVGRNRIRQRPKAFWQRWLDWLHSPMPDGSEPTQEVWRTRGIYLERFFVRALNA